MELSRKLTLKEEKLLDFLIRKSSKKISENWKEGFLVNPMNDGDMGSLRLIPKGINTEGRLLGSIISDLKFQDVDGVDVLVSLMIDNNENLFELDIWKTNFDKLITLPDL